MSDVKVLPTGEVLCPNHGCALEDVPWPLPEKGTGRCPVSGAMFEFEAKPDKEEVIQLKDGTVTKKLKWEVTGEE